MIPFSAHGAPLLYSNASYTPKTPPQWQTSEACNYYEQRNKAAHNIRCLLPFDLNWGRGNTFPYIYHGMYKFDDSPPVSEFLQPLPGDYVELPYTTKLNGYRAGDQREFTSMPRYA